MEPQHRQLLQRNYRALGNQLGPDIEEICFSLYEKNILNEAMKQDVMAQRTALEQTYKLLDIIVRRGPKAFPMLYEACKEQDLFQACDILMPCNAPHEPQEESLSSDELMPDSAKTEPEEDVDPWLEPETYKTKLQNHELKCRQIVSENLYQKHINDIGFYQMTKSTQGRMFLLCDGEQPVFYLDRMILDQFCNEFNFKPLHVKRIKEQTDLTHLLKICLDCNILMIFLMASGPHGFFNRYGNSGLKSLKSILKEEPGLANIPKLIFHMTLGSDGEDSGEEVPDANGNNTMKGGKPEANRLKNDTATEAIGVTPGTEKGQDTSRVVSDDNTETPTYSRDPENILLDQINVRKTKQKPEFDEDRDLHDGPGGTVGHRTPKDSDFFHIKVSNYGCELLDMPGEKMTRFFHLIVDVFFKKAYEMEFLNLIRHANSNRQQPVVKLQSTGRRKLYFFPRCNNDID